MKTTASLSSALVIDTFDPVYFEDAYYLGARKQEDRGYRVLVASGPWTARHRPRGCSQDR